MELFENLSSVGITTKMLQLAILAGIVIFLVGMYWRFIVIGAGIVFCVAVFAMGTGSNITKVESPAVIAPEDEVPQEFIDDCLRLSDNATKTSCIKMWKEDGNGNQ